MCSECEKLKLELEDLRSKWNSSEQCYYRSIHLTEQRLGGYSIECHPDGKVVSRRWGKEIE